MARQDSRSVQRIAVYRELILALASLRIAWNADDTKALVALMRDDAWVQLPGVGDRAGRATSADLERVLSGYGNLYTVEMDFDYGGHDCVPVRPILCGATLRPPALGQLHGGVSEPRVGLAGPLSERLLTAGCTPLAVASKRAHLVAPTGAGRGGRFPAR